MKTGEWKLIDPYYGAHIRVKFADFYHHGIYVDDSNVIQFGLPSEILQNPKDIKVISTSLEKFCGQSLFFEVYVFSKKELKTKKSDDEIVAKAKSLIGMDGYNIIHNNCEHFANLCVFGVKKSDQVSQVYQDVAKLLNK